MSGFKPKESNRSFDVGYARASVPEREFRERTPEQKAADAQTIADNLGCQCEFVRDSVAAMASAAAAEDRAKWTIAKQAADAGVARIRDTVKAALAAATDASAAQVRAYLTDVEQLLTDAQALIAGARAAPEIRAPVMTCADALLAVLPPLSSPPGPVEPVYAAAESAVKSIFRSQMTRSDIRAFEAIERVRTPRGATADQVAAGARRVIDEDNLRHALKVEFREAFFACAAREATPEARLARFRDITQDLKSADRGNLVEDFLARRDPGSVQQVAVKQADHPHLGLTAKERHIDRVSADGIAVEVKSIKGKLSADDLVQLGDYRKMVTAKDRDKISVLVAGKPTKIERAMYEFSEPAGVRANLVTIQEELLGKSISVKVYNQSGHARILKEKDDLSGIEEWLAQ